MSTQPDPSKMKTWRDVEIASLGRPWTETAKTPIDVTGYVLRQVVMASESIGREAALIAGVLALAEMAQHHFQAHLDCLNKRPPAPIIIDGPFK